MKFLLSLILLTFYQFNLCHCINELSCFEVDDFFCVLKEVNLTKEDPSFTVLSSVSEVITYIGFEESVIPILTGDVCQDLKNLESITAYKASVELIASETFKKCSGLKELALWSNEIKSLPAYVFQHLSNLKQLNLNYNQIEYVHPKAFYNLENLEELEMRRANLTYISYKAFIPLKKLKKLDLANNNLLDLNIEFLLSNQPALALTEIAIYDNSFNCNRESLMKKKIKEAGVKLGKPIISLGGESKCKQAKRHQELVVQARTYLEERYPVVEDEKDS